MKGETEEIHREAEAAYRKIPEKQSLKRLANPNGTAEDPCHSCPDKNTPQCSTENCLIEDPENRDEMLHWKRIAYEFRHVPATMGDFYFHLCETIVRADLANTAKLRAAYPELVQWIQDEDL